MHTVVTPRPTHRAAAGEAGFSLIELMIAITLGLLLVAGLAATFANSSRTRDSIERAGQQIENGRYAMQVLSNDLALAGYLAEYNPIALATPVAKPDPCATALADLTGALMLQVQGYDSPAAPATAPALTCLNDVKPNTDILVVRRVSTCVAGTANCPVAAVAPYFQASLCGSAAELESGAAADIDKYRLDTDLALLDRHKKNCTTFANTRQFLTRIYFIANNDGPGDGIPTLKRAELAGKELCTDNPPPPNLSRPAPCFVIFPVAQGIENLQLEYGINSNPKDGIPNDVNADPDSLAVCAGVACISGVENWRNVVSVKVNLLARNTSPSGGHNDTKKYSLGLLANGAANEVGPFNDPFMRHVFQSEVRINNLAGRRE